MFKSATVPTSVEEVKSLLNEIAHALPFDSIGMSHGDWLRRVSESPNSLVLINRLCVLYRWAGVRALENFGHEPVKQQIPSETVAPIDIEIVRAVVDAWMPIKISGLGMDRALADSLDRLEVATRSDE